MPNQKIDITGIDSHTGKLILSDHGRTEVLSHWKFRKVTWKIRFSKVKSILIVGKTGYNPFETPIPVTYATDVKLTVNKGEPATDWEYSIHWKDEHGNVTISDPLIAIRSSIAPLSPQEGLKGGLLITLIVVLLSLLGISYFGRKKKNSK